MLPRYTRGVVILYYCVSPPAMAYSLVDSLRPSGLIVPRDPRFSSEESTEQQTANPETSMYAD